MMVAVALAASGVPRTHDSIEETCALIQELSSAGLWAGNPPDWSLSQRSAFDACRGVVAAWQGQQPAP